MRKLLTSVPVAVALAGLLIAPSSYAQSESAPDPVPPSADGGADDEGDGASDAGAADAGSDSAGLFGESTLLTDPPKRWFTLDRFDGFLELEFQHDETQVNTQVQTGEWWRPRRSRRQTNRDSNMVERLGFDVSGSVVDPSVMTFAGEFSFGLMQSRYAERGWYGDLTDDDNGMLLLYDMRFGFLQGHKLSGTAYALRQNDRINRRFLPTLRERRTGFGTSWFWADEKLPMEFRYDYLDTDREGNDDIIDNENFVESTLFYGANWIISPHHNVRFTYEHAETQQHFQGALDGYDTTRDLFNIEHTLAFGDTHQHRFDNRINWQEETGDFARDYFQIQPTVTLQHDDNLQTQYRYQYNEEDYEALEVETHRADFQLIHQLYTNLTTTANVFGLYEDITDDVKTSQYGAMVDWQYNRKNDYGVFMANLALAYDTEQVSGDNGPRLVLNESHAFRDPLDITLRNRNVRPWTIVVTDTSNRRVFVRGVDYIVYELRGFTRLQRLFTGRIADNDTILVDYQYDSPAGGSVDTVRADFSIEQQFDNGFRPYYRLSYRDQDADRTVGFGRFADRTDHHRLGVDYRKDDYSANVEVEAFDDTIEPYNAFHANGVWYIVRGPEHQVSATARYSHFWFEAADYNRDVDVIDMDLDHRWKLRENLSTFERFGFRFQDDSVAGITRAWDIVAGVDYVLGDLNAEFTIEYDRLELPYSQEDDFGVYFRVRRDFRNLLSAL